MSAGAAAPASTPVGVLLMTFGSATTEAGVADYVASMRAAHGRPVPAVDDEVVTEFRRRYALIGRSPLVQITRAQADAVEQELARRHGPGRFRVEAGMLHSEPRIAAALDRLVAAGAGRVIAVTLAPQYSPLILTGYVRAVAAARERLEPLEIHVCGAWHDLPEFIESLAGRTAAALERWPQSDRDQVPVVFTAHSVPEPVVARDPGYIEQLKATAAAIAARLNLDPERWSFAYQSAGHTPEEWLKPDLLDVLPLLRNAGHTDVLVVPLQFVADHLEILYDIDVAAREQAEACGLRFSRIDLPNTSPAFIRALAAVVEREAILPVPS